MSIEQFGYQQQLRRALTLGDLIIFGMIFMVPTAPYTAFGFVWSDAKGMAPLAYLIGLVGMLFTALSYAAMSEAFPLAGSVYTYAQRGLHEVAGFFSGWLILLDYILVPSLIYLFSAVARRPILPQIPAWSWLVAFVSMNAAANFFGVEFTARVYRYLLVMELATLVLFVVLGLHALYGGVGAGRLTWRRSWERSSCCKPGWPSPAFFLRWPATARCPPSWLKCTHAMRLLTSARLRSREFRCLSGYCSLTM